MYFSEGMLLKILEKIVLCQKCLEMFGLLNQNVPGYFSICTNLSWNTDKCRSAWAVLPTSTARAVLPNKLASCCM
jgi:hypothetical protein